jgi:hypothetical protein
MTIHSPNRFLKELFPFSNSDLAKTSEILNKVNIDIEEYKNYFYKEYELWEEDCFSKFRLETDLLWLIVSKVQEQYSKYFSIHKTHEEIIEIQEEFKNYFA